MPIDTHPKRQQGRLFPEEIVAEQKRQAEAQTAAKKAAVPAKVAATAPAPLAGDARTATERYVDEIAPSNIAGQMVKFSKEGKFVINETEETIDPDRDFIALCDEVLVGWIKFSDDDSTPPERVQGLLYRGFIPPLRDTLGDLDQAKWPKGLSGQPADPWHHQMCLVLQDPRSLALFTFVTSSITGRRSVGNLLRHFDRTRRNDPNSGYPVVRLKPSGYESKKYGWVHTPSFAVVGRTKAPSSVPDTSVAADMNDEIPL
jgi:hypothetical protein